MQELKGKSKKIIIDKKSLKSVQRKIWLVETKISWLKFLMGQVANSKSYNPALLYLTISIALFIIYLALDKFIISEILALSQFKIVIHILFIVIFCFLGIYSEEKSFQKINDLENDLGLLYKKESNLTNKINQK